MTEVFDATALVRSVFHDAHPLGSAAWAASVRNGQPHEVRVVIRGGATEIVAAPDVAGRSPAELTAVNAQLPRGCRLMCGLSGVRLVAEAAETSVSALERVSAAFESALDVLAGAEVAVPPALAVPFDEDPAQWTLEPRSDGARELRLSYPGGHWTVSVAGGACAVVVAKPGGYEFDVCEALSEFLLRATATVRFVRACSCWSEGAWSAWLEVSREACALNEALTALALVCRDGGAATAALTDPGLAAIYRSASSVFNEGR